jgi:soluble lytic murein transglycosylase
MRSVTLHAVNRPLRPFFAVFFALSACVRPADVSPRGPAVAAVEASVALPALAWPDLVQAPECRSKDSRIAAALQAEPEWRNHFLGTRILCALDADDPSGASALLARIDVSAEAAVEWQSLATWAAWFATSTPTELPAWPPYGAELIRKKALARAEADPAATWVRSWILRDPAAWNWRGDAAPALLAVLTPAELARIAVSLTSRGRPSDAWRVRRAQWHKLGVKKPVSQMADWHEPPSARAQLELARLAFAVREWPIAAAAGRAAWRGGEAEGLLWWGRGMARQGRMREAGDVWARHLGSVQSPLVRVAVAYRLGIVAEELRRPTEALRWYAQAAAVSIEHEDREEAGFRAGWLPWQVGDAVAAAQAWRLELQRPLSIVAGRRVRYWLARASADEAVAEQLRQESPLSYYAWRWDARTGRAPAVEWRAPEPVTPPAGLAEIRRAATAGLAEPAAGMLAAAWRQAEDPQAALAVLATAQELGWIDESFRWFWNRFEAGLREAAPTLDRDMWEILHPRPWADVVEREAARRGIDPLLVWSVMREESRFKPAVESPVGALGLLQIMPETGRMLAQRHGVLYTGAENLVDPEVNIALGAAYLADLLTDYDGRLHFAVAAYNAGPAAVNRWRAGGVHDIDVWAENIPYTETRNYVRKVLRSYIRYRALYAPDQGAPTDVATLRR